MKTITIALSGADTATCGDTAITVKRGSVVGTMARKLIDAGESPATVAHVVRGATPCFMPATLKSWAGRTVSEGENNSPRFAKWTPFSPSVFA